MTVNKSGKKIVSRVRIDGAAKEVGFTWSEGSSSFPPYRLRGDQEADFRKHTAEARARLLELADHHLVPAAGRNPAKYAAACLELAKAGRRLYNTLFDKAAVADTAVPGDGGRDLVGSIQDWLRELTRAGRVESLEIVCDDSPWFAPWNVVYDEFPTPDAFPLWTGEGPWPSGFAPFWGMRYNLCGGRSVNPLRRMPLPPDLRVLAVIDPGVLENLGRHPDPADPELSQREALEAFLAGMENLDRVGSVDELAGALVGRTPPHVIYWLSHADPEALTLQGQPIDQTDLRDLLKELDRKQGQAGGLVFLNACQTAQSSNLGSFLTTFHDYGFVGLIGTECETVDSFASPFGLGVLRRFLARDTPIGPTLHELRRTYGPLGLLYGAYCPPDLYVRPLAAAAAEVGGANVTDPTAAGGETLGRSLAPPAAAAAAAREVERLVPLPAEPYLPLGTYGAEHRALFAGRDEDVRRFALILGRHDTRVVLLHGESGVGKTSFLRAGAIPYLEGEECVGYRFLRDGRGADAASPVLFIRATGDPAGQLAQALVSFCSVPYVYRTPNDDEVRVDLASELADAADLAAPAGAADLRAALLADPDRLTAILERLSLALPVTLVLVVDQAEEVITLADPADNFAARGRSLRMLGRLADAGGDFKVIVALRTEFYGRVTDAFRRADADMSRVRDYLLADLDELALLEAIVRPTLNVPVTHAAEVPRAKYRFRYAPGVAEEVARQVMQEGRRDGVLPLLQVICGQLHDRLPPEGGEVTRDDLAAIGGVKGGMRRHADATVARLSGGDPIVRVALRRVVCGLYERQPDGTLTTRLIPAADLARKWRGPSDFREALDAAREARLLRVNTLRIGGADSRPFVSLGHDALARVAADWDQDRQRNARALRVAAVAVPVVLAGLAIAYVKSEETSRTYRQNEQIKGQNQRIQSLAVAAEERRKEADAARAVAEARGKETLLERNNARRQLAEVYLERGRSLCERSEQDRGMLWLVRSLEEAPAEERGLRDVILRMIGREGKTLHPLLGVYDSSDVAAFAYGPDGRAVVALGDAGTKSRTLRLHDAATGEPFGEPLPHGAVVVLAEFDPTAWRLVTTTFEGTTQLWDARTGRPLTDPMPGQTLPSTAQSPGQSPLGNTFSADGSTFATVRAGWTYQSRDAATFEPVGRAIRLPRQLLQVAYSDDGRTLAGRDDAHNVRVWSVATGEPVTHEIPHAQPVSDLAFAPGGRAFAVAGTDGVRLYDARTGRLLTRTSDVPTGGSVVFRRDGSAAVLIGKNSVRLVETATGRTIGREVVVQNGFSNDPVPHTTLVYRAALYPHPEAPVALARVGEESWRRLDFERGTSVGLEADYEQISVAPDGRTFVARSRGSVRLRDACDGRPIGAPLPTRYPVGRLNAILYSDDSRRVLVSDYPKWVALDTTDGHSLGQADGDVTDGEAWFTPDGSAVVVRSNPTDWFWKLSEPKPRGLGAGVQPHSVQFSPDGQLFAVISHPARLTFHLSSTGELHSGPFLWQDTHDGYFLPDGRAYAVIEKGSIWPDRRRSVWRGRGIDEQNHPAGRPVTAVGVSPRGETILTVSERETLKLYGSTDGTQADRPLHHLESVQGLAFTPDGRRVFTWTEQHLHLWDTASGRRVGTPFPLESAAGRFALSPDGRSLAWQGPDYAVRFTDTRTGRATGPALPHDRLLSALRFSPDGQTLLTGVGMTQSGAQPTVSLWDVPTGRRVASLTLGGWVSKVAFSSEGETFACWDQELIVGRVADGSVAPRAELRVVEDVLPGADGRRLLIRHWKGVETCSLGPGGFVYQSLKDDGQASDAVLSPGRVSRLAVLAEDAKARVWDMETAKVVGPPLRQADSSVRLRAGPDGRSVWASESVNRKLWDVSGARLGHLPSVLVGPGAETVATVHLGDIVLWDGRSGRPLCKPFVGSLEPVKYEGLSFSPDGALFAVWNPSGIWVYDARNGQEIGRASRRAFEFALRFSADRKRIAAVEPKAALVHELSLHGSDGTFIDLGETLRGVEFATDGRALVGRNEAGVLRAFDVTTGRAVPPPAGHDWLDQGGAPGRTIRLWDANTGQPIPGGELSRLFEDPEGDDTAPAPDAPRLIRRWVEATTGQELTPEGAARTLNADAWRARRDEFRRLTGVAHADFGRALKPGTWYEQLAHISQRDGEPAAWLWQLDRLVGAFPADLALRQQRGNQLMALGRFREAADDLRAWYDAHADEENGFGAWLEALVLARRLDEAAAACRTRLARRPDESFAATAYRNLLLLAGDLEGLSRESRARFGDFGGRPVLTDPEANALAWLAAPVPADVFGPSRFAGCLRLARQAARQNSHSFVNTLGALLYRAGEFEEAAVILEKSAATPNDSFVTDRVFLALTYHRLGRRVDAERWLDQAVALFRQNAAAAAERRNSRPVARPRRIGDDGDWLQALEDQALIREAVAEIAEGHPAYLPMQVFAAP